MTGRAAQPTAARPALAGLLAIAALGLCGLPGCAFCPAGLEPTAADRAAGLSCHFSPEQEALRQQREEGWRHPPPAGW